jgi:hypothetical protein
MYTSKKWLKDEDFLYSLWDNGTQLATMQIAMGSLARKATVVFNQETLVMKRTGFWKTQLEISNQHEETIAKVYSEKWYANRYVLEYGSKKYSIEIRNNPLAEYLIFEDGKELIAYGLITENKLPAVRISATAAQLPLLFDFILWYLFTPIIMEQSGQDVVFLTMIA